MRSFSGLQVTGDVRKVPSKPAKIGLWFYELAGPLDNKTSFLVDLSLASSWGQKGEVEKMSEVVGRWGNILVGEEVHSPSTIIVHDSYYMSRDGRKLLNEKKVKVIGATTKQKCDDLDLLVTSKIEKSGDFAGLYNIKTGESFMYVWDKDRNLGKKMVWSNCFTPKGKKCPKQRIPIYDEYSKMFSVCDSFNKGLHDCVWPHKCGGYTMPGVQGQVNVFAMACILHNTRNAYVSIKKIEPFEYSFEDFCLDLSEALYEHSCRTINELN